MPTHPRAIAVDIQGDATVGCTSRVSRDLGRDITVLRARRVHGRFARVVPPAGVQASVSYSRSAVTVRLRPA